MCVSSRFLIVLAAQLGSPALLSREAVFCHRALQYKGTTYEGFRVSSIRSAMRSRCAPATSLQSLVDRTFHSGTSSS